MSPRQTQDQAAQMVRRITQAARSDRRSLKEIFTEAKIDQQSFYNWENGSLPRIDSLMRLAMVVGLTLEVVNYE